MRLLLLIAVALLCGPQVRADEAPLRQLIDEHLPVFEECRESCSELEGLRRVSLDLIGRPPTSDEARAYLADESPGKWEQLVDRLMTSPLHARHFAEILSVMLMERRGHKHVPQAQWEAWLLQSVRENKPWNVLVREILAADGDTDENRAPARFALDRAAEPNLLTRDVSRIFFGRDIQCAQCHDHPSVDDYLQADYHGLLAFLAPTYVVAIKKGDADVSVLAEKAGSDVTFESVFFKGTPHRIGPRVPGRAVIDEQRRLPGNEYLVAPVKDAKVKTVPAFSRRAALADEAARDDNRAFNENIANRLWEMMFGRGLVSPGDMHHPENPPTHPELLRLLGERLAASGFDMRNFLREIALSGAYSRGYDPPQDLLAVAARASGAIPESEQPLAGLEQAAADAGTAYESALEAWIAAEQALIPAAAEQDAARTAYAEARKTFQETNQTLKSAHGQLAEKRDVLPTVQDAATAAEEAVKKLPADEVLKAAAQKFAERVKLLNDEIAALQKTVEETTPKLPEATAAFDSAKATLAATQEKSQPLRDQWKQREAEMRAARNRMVELATQRNALKSRVKTLQQMASLQETFDGIATAETAVVARRAELPPVEQQLAEHRPLLAEREAEQQQAAAALVAANEGQGKAQQALDAQAELVQTILDALSLLNKARAQLPEDSTLAEMAVRLQERADAYTAQTAEPKQRFEEASAVVEAAQQRADAAAQALAEARAELDRRQKNVDAVRERIAAAQSELDARRAAYADACAELTEQLSANVMLANLKPLTPEQLCWSIFQVTGVYAQYRKTEIAELDKETPLTDEQKQDPEQTTARELLIEQKVYDKLKGNLATFAKYFGASAGESQGSFFATVDQALYAANGGEINSWTGPREDNVTTRMAALENDAAAEELYLTVLTRLPTAEEVKQVSGHLSGREDRAVAAQELVWSLINSAEFRFNH